jgi:hypothetical protein
MGCVRPAKHLSSKASAITYRHEPVETQALRIEREKRRCDSESHLIDITCPRASIAASVAPLRTAYPMI